jgi:hypothetical protein
MCIAEGSCIFFRVLEKVERLLMQKGAKSDEIASHRSCGCSENLHHTSLCTEKRSRANDLNGRGTDFCRKRSRAFCLVLGVSCDLWCSVALRFLAFPQCLGASKLLICESVGDD